MNPLSSESRPLAIGWASTSLTPDQPVQLTGQHYARVSEGVLDPVTATALILAPGGDPAGAVCLVSCDLVSISDSLWAAVRRKVTAAIPELDAGGVILNATHTHSAPLARTAADEYLRVGSSIQEGELELPAMAAGDYIAWASDRIAAAVAEAWRARAPGAIGFGLGQAVVGRNRRSCYLGGEARMYGDTTKDDFSHIEGYEDHSVNLLATWNASGSLTGLVVNVACPSQVSEHSFQVSADYWHDTRVELRRRLGPNLFVLPQCSAAGDQSPHIQWGKAAEERMMKLSGRSLRQQIAVRLADAAETALPAMAADRQAAPLVRRRSETVALARRRLTQKDVDEAMAQAEPLRLEYERLCRELEAHPEQREQPRWYVPATRAYRRWRWHANVKLRFENERLQGRFPAELHAIRLGDLAIATNPFEYYLDYGVRIKARSPAVQTFLVQLAGGGSYVPTERAVAGKSYGAVPASTPVGPEGGRELAEWTVSALRALWA
jgi:hypothetical protein